MTASRDGFIIPPPGGHAHGMATAALVPEYGVRAPVRPAAVSFERLFAEHVRYVGRTLRYLGVAPADLDDACQEVFLVVHRRLGDLAVPEGARSWIRQICVHVARNAKRTARRRHEAGEVPADMPAPATQHATAERTQLRERLLQALSRLSEEQRVVFVLYEIEELAMTEVAAAVGCPLQTAYSRLHAARGRVRQSLTRAVAP